MTNFLLSIIILLLAGGGWYAWDTGLIGASDTRQNEVTHEPVPEVKSEAIWHNASSNEIRVDQPLPGSSVGHSFAISGAARGGWYFEASFPIEVVDKDGNQLFQGPVQAQGDWMTPEFVPFSTTITLSGSYRGPALVIFRNDNPSGLLENEKSVSIPIVIE